MPRKQAALTPRSLNRIDHCFSRNPYSVSRRRSRCEKMEVLAGSRAWIEASTGHVWDKGGNESRRCPFDLELELIQGAARIYVSSNSRQSLPYFPNLLAYVYLQTI
jgi:hypothetical protein